MSYAHRIAGVYPDEKTAREAAVELRTQDIASELVRVLGPADREALEDAWESPSDAGKLAAGAAAGGGIGLVGGALAGVTLVVAAPVAAALVAAGAGALAGAAVGKPLIESVTGETFAEIVGEALSKGNWAVLVRAQSEGQALAAQDLISRTEPLETVDHGGGTLAPGKTPPQ